MPLSVPIPGGRGIGKVSLMACLETFVRDEILDRDDAWCARFLLFPTLDYLTYIGFPAGTALVAKGAKVGQKAVALEASADSRHPPQALLLPRPVQRQGKLNLL